MKQQTNRKRQQPPLPIEPEVEAVAPGQHLWTDEQPKDYSLARAGYTIWDIHNQARNAAFAFCHLPRLVCELIVTKGWRHFTVPYKGTVVQYAEGEFAAFVKDHVAGLDINMLIAICTVAGTPEANHALALLANEKPA